MSANEVPVALRKQINYIQNNSHLDEECGNSDFFSAVSKMYDSEKIFTLVREMFKDGNVDDVMSALCITLGERIVLYQKYYDSVVPRILDTGIGRNKALVEERRLLEYSASFYQDFGDLLAKFGIIQSLTARSNSAFSRVNAPFLSIQLEQAMSEFEKKRNMQTTTPVIHMKIAFYMNKITKYMDDLEYGAMYDSDMSKRKVGMNKRLYFLSKLKTDYLRRVYEANANLSEDGKIKVFGSQKEYEELFGEFFEDLDFDTDYERIRTYELGKSVMYGYKGFYLSKSLSNLIATGKRKMDRDIKRWGIGEDGNGGYVFGMDLYSYPMPITVHVKKPFLVGALKSYQMSVPSVVAAKTIIPKYESVRTPDKKIFTTNVLFVSTEVQRSRIIAAVNSGKSNECIQFFYEQINSRTMRSNFEDGYTIAELM